MDSSKKPTSVSANASAASSPRTAFGVQAATAKQSSSSSTPRRQHARSELRPPPIQQPAIKVPQPISNKSGARDNYSDEDEMAGASSSVQGHYRHGGNFTVLQLDCLSKMEIKESVKNARLIPYGFGDDEEENTEEEEAENQINTVIGPDRARFNVWKGQNYDLHVLGNFKSDFEKRVKSFQRPAMESILLDPFCRGESGLEDEPAKADAFVVWKSQSKTWECKNIGTVKNSKNKMESAGDDDDITTSSDERESDAESCCSTSSVEDPEIKAYIQSQKKKQRQGLNVSGETLYYDEDFSIIRNLHRDSYSMTNYGTMPDEKCLGKAHVFYPEMTLEEKNMLQPVDFEREVKKKSSKTISTKPPRGKGKQPESLSMGGTKYLGSKECGDFATPVI